MLPNHNPGINPAHSPLDKLLLKGSKVRTYLLCQEAAEYRTYLQAIKDECLERLVAIKDEKEADRLRGEIRILSKLLSLPDTITEYLRGVSNGTFKKITEENIINV